MRLQHAETPEPRYDAATLKKVTSLAQRLQAEQRDTLTAREIESVGAEVGLDPAFIRSALAHLEAEQRRQGIPREGVETGELVAIGTGSAIMAIAAFFLSNVPSDNGGLMAFLWLIFPTAFPAFLGFITKRPKLGMVTGLSIILAQLIAGVILTATHGGGGEVTMAGLFYLCIGAPTAASLGWLGGWARQQLSRPAGQRVRQVAQPVEPSRRELLEAVMNLQRQLEGPKVHRVFLSVDVAGAAELKRGEGELAIEYSFTEFQHWVEEIAVAHGGQVLPSVTEGTLCVFADEAVAVRAARQLQETLRRFNESANRLSRQFRVRCGVAGGEVSAGSLSATTRPQTWLVDHAIALQRSADPGDIRVSQSAAGPALEVLGALSRAGDTVEGEPAYSWRGSAPAEPGF